MTTSDDIVTPRHFLRYLAETLKMRPSEIALPARAALVFGGDDFRRLRSALGAKLVPHSRWLGVGRPGRRRVALARSTIGAPAAAILMEEMAARGVREFITFGACGSLVEDLRIGDVVVPTFAQPDDGTSRHYGGSRWPRPDPALVAAVTAACNRRALPFRQGGVWTTDAPYRESRTRARSLARRGVVCVDMEAAALYAVARHRGLRVGSLCVVSDELGGEGWNPGFWNPAFLRAKRRALRVVVDTLSRPHR